MYLWLHLTSLEPNVFPMIGNADTRIRPNSEVPADAIVRACYNLTAAL